MKNFLLQLFKFGVIGIAILVFLLSLSNYLLRKNVSFKVPSHIDKIVIGHSHTECALDDSLIKDFANLSDSSETYNYSYFKLVQLLNQNDQIKTVFVGFTNNQINKESDKKMWSEKYIQYRYPLFAPFMDIEDEYLLLRKNIGGFSRGLSLLIKNNLKTVFQKDYNYAKKVGGHKELKREGVPDALAHASSTTHSDRNDAEISRYNLHYLEKIIAECQKRGIKIYLIRTPVHPKHEWLENEKTFQSLRKSRFSKIDFLDFKNFPLENIDLADLEHLNSHGAKKFSSFLNSLLQNGLLEKGSKQIFIDLEIDKLKSETQ